MRPVLFISHDASRTGAPIRFLNLLRWIRNNTEIPFIIGLRRGGVLQTEFEELAPVVQFDRHAKTGRMGRIIRRMGFFDPHAHIVDRLMKENIGLVYANTITNGELLQRLFSLHCPVITAVNELEYLIRLLAPRTFDLTKTYSNRFVACSEAVKRNLTERHDIPGELINVIYGFIPIPTGLAPSSSSVITGIRSELGIPSDAFVLGASGKIDWHKGPDLFIQLAAVLRRKVPDAPLHFVWLGADTTDLEYFKVQLEIESTGLADRIHVVGVKTNPFDYFSLFDVFTMISRVDSFPLVGLEAAALGKPILCFDKAGGMPEFVEQDCGFVVPYLDLDAMADRAIELYRFQELHDTLGKNAAKKVRERHDIEKCAPRVAELILTYMMK